MKYAVAVLISAMLFIVGTISFATPSHSVYSIILARSKSKSKSKPINHSTKKKHFTWITYYHKRSHKYFDKSSEYLSRARVKAGGDGVNYNLTNHLAMTMQMISINNPNNTVPAVHGGLAGFALKF